METQPAAAAVGVPKTRLEFAYDAQGRRIRKVVKTWDGSAYAVASDTRFLYDGWNLIAELNGLASNAVVRSYVWGADLSGTMQGAGGVGGLLAVNAGTATYLPAFDGGGNVLAYIDAATGASAAEFEYGPFGEPLRVTGAAAANLPFRFSTKYTDAETGLVYYGYRWYDPSTGRFMSKDPIAERGGVNLYCFVRNAPVGTFDYLGREPVTIPRIIISLDPQPSPPPRPVDGGFGFNWGDEAGWFRDLAGGRDNPNVGNGSTGADLLSHMEGLTKQNCCIKNYTIAGHGRGGPGRASLPSSADGPNGLFAPSDPQYLQPGGRGGNSRTTDDIRAAVQDGRIKFCKPCVIQIYACYMSGLAQSLAQVTGCRVVAAGGSCSSANDRANGNWRSDGPEADHNNFWQSDGSTPVPIGPIYNPVR